MPKKAAQQWTGRKNSRAEKLGKLHILSIQKMQAIRKLHVHSRSNSPLCLMEYIYAFDLYVNQYHALEQLNLGTFQFKTQELTIISTAAVGT